MEIENLIVAEKRILIPTTSNSPEQLEQAKSALCKMGFDRVWIVGVDKMEALKFDKEIDG